MSDIGAGLIEDRRRGVPWKVLEWKYGYRRTRLWMLWRAAKDVHEQLAACEPRSVGPG
jgi:hypothetical protein